MGWHQRGPRKNLTSCPGLVDHYSQQVKALESQLGIALFKRLARGLELTEAGKSYFPVVRESVERLAASTDEIFGQGHRSALIIRSSLVFFTHWIAPRLPRFQALHPNVNLRIASNIWVDDSEFDADLEIRYGQGRWPGMKSERLTWDTLVPVCSPALITDEHPLQHPQDLAKHQLLHVLGYEEGWGYWLQKNNAETVDSSEGVQFDTLISALAVAELGQGIALGRSSLVKHLLDEGRLVAPLGGCVPTKEAFYLTYSSRSLVNPVAAAFAQWLCDEAKSFRALSCEGVDESEQ